MPGAAHRLGPEQGKRSRNALQDSEESRSIALIGWDAKAGGVRQEDLGVVAPTKHTTIASRSAASAISSHGAMEASTNLQSGDGVVGAVDASEPTLSVTADGAASARRVML